MNKPLLIAIIASALGFFVDLYDIIIVSIVRTKSLLAIGVPEAELLPKGVLLLNVQMAGMLLGGFVWGIIGDKFGRLSVLFGSIALYSSMTFLNAYIGNYDQYLVLRFLAGMGLAGELGAAITLVAEQMPQRWRGLGPALIGSFGMLGAIVGAQVGAHFSWQFTYQLGGILGFALMFLRLGVVESGLYNKIKTEVASGDRGNLWLIFGNAGHRKKYLSIFLLGFPGWFVNGVVMTFTPEIARSWGMTDLPSVSNVFTAFFIGFTFGDLSCGIVSQWLRSRKQAIGWYLGLFAVGMGLFFLSARYSVALYYGLFVWLGITAGYTIVLLTLAAEQFGGNIRATVTTSGLNLVRASVIPQATLFVFLSQYWGAANAAMAVGALAIVLAFWALGNLEETFDKNLDFVEQAAK